MTPGERLLPAVRVEITRRFDPANSREAADLLAELALPLLDRPGREVDRARVQLALVKLAGGNVTLLRHWAQQAAVDWRDVLVAAGLANADWRTILARDGFTIPDEGCSA